MKRAHAFAPLLGCLAWSAAAPLSAAPAAPSAADADVPIDPNIARASAEADADAGNTSSSNGPQTPYEKALLNYKSGKYDAAKLLIDEADQEKPGDIPIEMLKVRILTELHDFAGAHHALDSLYDRSDLTPEYALALDLTAGDLSLRQRHFDAATKSYLTYLQSQPNDPDAKLKLIYARLGVGDLVTAGRLASELKPNDLASPAYYFGQAALAHAGVGASDEEQDFEQSRTIYGITITNRYLKTFLEVFANKSTVNSALNPPATNAAPSGKAL